MPPAVAVYEAHGEGSHTAATSWLSICHLNFF
jgi:hypothetical protein